MIDQTPAVGEPSTLDDRHATAVEDAMQADVARMDAGEATWVRALVDDHELCPPGACLTWPAGTVVVVTVLAPGIRIRRPVVAPLVGVA